MIITLTPNPSLDRTYEVPGLLPGAVLRCTADRVDPGGKGVNVSRALAAAGHRTVSVLPLGGVEGALLAELLEAQGIPVAQVPIDGKTRVNISVVEPDGRVTKLNAAGPELAAAESKALLAEVTARSAQAAWLACCGSLPRGLPPEWYAELVGRVHDAGARIALDTTGPALLAALSQRPDVIKPNREELAEAVGGRITTVGEALQAARQLRDLGARAVLASLGADGQLLVDSGGAAWFGTATVETVRSNVGAGDASLAGFLGAGGSGERALAAALTHGAAAVRLPGSVMPAPADLRPGDVRTTADIPVNRALKEQSA